MSARVDEELGEGVLAVFNGMKFKMNDLVDVIVGTGLGVRGNKTEPFKGHFKGVVETVRGVEFLVKPLVSGNGRSLQIPRHSVFKISAFGSCVLGRTTRFFSKLKPASQERYVYNLCVFPRLYFDSCLFIDIKGHAEGKCGVTRLLQKVRKETHIAKRFFNSSTCHSYVTENLPLVLTLINTLRKLSEFQDESDKKLGLALSRAKVNVQ
jgi:hypothetical protein